MVYALMVGDHNGLVSYAEIRDKIDKALVPRGASRTDDPRARRQAAEGQRAMMDLFK